MHVCARKPLEIGRISRNTMNEQQTVLLNRSPTNYLENKKGQVEKNPKEFVLLIKTSVKSVRNESWLQQTAEKTGEITQDRTYHIECTF